VTVVNDLLAQLQSQGYGTDTASTQLRFLDRAWDRVMSLRRWSFMDRTDTIVLGAVASYSLAGLSSPMRYFDGLRFKDYRDPKFLPYQEFRDATDGGVATGVPTVYTVRGGSLLFYPTPTVGYPGTVYIDYNAKGTLPSAAADPAVTDLGTPDQFTGILVWNAIGLMAFRQRDSEAQQMARAEASVLMGEYMAEIGIEQRQNAQHAVSTGVHEQYTDVDFLI